MQQVIHKVAGKFITLDMLTMEFIIGICAMSLMIVPDNILAEELGTGFYHFPFDEYDHEATREPRYAT